MTTTTTPKFPSYPPGRRSGRFHRLAGTVPVGILALLLALTSSSPGFGVVSAAEMTGGTWETISFNGFEKEDGSGRCDLNGWVDPGADAKLINNNWNVRSGNCALRLRDDSDTSTATSVTLPVANYDALKVAFWYKPKRMTASSEEFHLYISKNGEDFTLEHTWSSDGRLGSTEFTDNSYQQGIVDDIDVKDASEVRIRFVCNGDTNQDRVFIDDITIKAMPTSSPTKGPTASPTKSPSTSPSGKV